MRATDHTYNFILDALDVGLRDALLIGSNSYRCDEVHVLGTVQLFYKNIHCTVTE